MPVDSARPVRPLITADITARFTRFCLGPGTGPEAQHGRYTKQSRPGHYGCSPVAIVADHAYRLSGELAVRSAGMSGGRRSGTTDVPRRVRTGTSAPTWSMLA
jgi:hypothetical protein